MSWWTGIVPYAGLLAILALTVALSWRLMGRAARRVVIALALLVAVAMSPFHFLPGGLSPRCVVGYLLNLPCLVDTGRYAPGYSHTRFREVQIGMTEQEIIDLLGEPVEHYRFSTGHKGWAYADAGDDAGIYFFACVYFAQGGTGVVVGKKWGVLWERVLPGGNGNYSSVSGRLRTEWE